MVVVVVVVEVVMKKKEEKGEREVWRVGGERGGKRRKGEIRERGIGKGGGGGRGGRGRSEWRRWR